MDLTESFLGKSMRGMSHTITECHIKGVTALAVMWDTGIG